MFWSASANERLLIDIALSYASNWLILMIVFGIFGFILAKHFA
jgi:hypothetical protein